MYTNIYIYIERERCIYIYIARSLAPFFASSMSAVGRQALSWALGVSAALPSPPSVVCYLPSPFCPVSSSPPPFPHLPSPISTLPSPPPISPLPSPLFSSPLFPLASAIYPLMICGGSGGSSHSSSSDASKSSNASIGLLRNWRQGRLQGIPRSTLQHAGHEPHGARVDASPGVSNRGQAVRASL